jgi:D-alanine-D-alanine ligase
MKEGYTQHPFDAQYGVETSGLVSGRHLGAGHSHDRHITAYFGVAPSIFRQLCQRWQQTSPPFDMKEASFLDIGAGMGRAMLLAAEMPFREVAGVELNADLARIAEKNIALWQAAGRSRCPAQILRQEATQFEFPPNPCVAFLFNPFSGTVLRRLLKRIESAFRDRPGELDILYVNHEFDKVLKQHAGFEQLWSGDIDKSPEDERADREILQNQPEGEYAASEYESCSVYRWMGTSAVITGSRRAGLPRRYNQERMTKKTSRKSSGQSKAKNIGKLRVGILFGGRSGEHEVSLLSAASVLKAIDRDRYEVVPLGITKEGRWLTGNPATAMLSSDVAAGFSFSAEAGSSIAALATADATPQPTALGRSLSVDVIFPVLHGTFGEDGTIQGLFEMADIAYVGSGVLGSAAGMDKDIMKRLFASSGLPTPKHISLLRGEWKASPKKVLKRVEEALKYPMFVKPANLGSSVGISKAHDRRELGPAIDLAANYDRKIVIERGIGGSKGKARELEVAVLGNDSPEASVVGEIVPAKEFYDYEAKYLMEGSVPIIPAKLTRAQAKRVRAMAIEAFRACDCAGLARVDFLLEPASKSGKEGRIFVNEVNTLPGFTKISMYPKLWEASGLSYPALIDRLIELALERRAEKDETSYAR